MKESKLEMVTRFYCDNCGEECTGNRTTFNEGTPQEKHACHGWIESEQTRCDLKLEQAINDAMRKRKSAPEHPHPPRQP